MGVARSAKIKVQNAKLSIRQAQDPEFIEGQFKIKNHPLFLISILYFVFRLINLTKLPIFNDEAIYLDWAWRETNEPGMLFYSLYDGKQPLLMWFFGIAMHVLPDPFFAGRLVSVLFGFLTMLGIYKLGKTYFSQRIAVISALLYIIIPIFSFYDRQALMEAAVGAVGVWATWFALLFWKKGKAGDAILTGVILGCGFLIKSSAILFFFSFFLLSIIFWIKKQIVIKYIFYGFAAFTGTIFLLLLQPKFWQTLSTNSRYGFGIHDLIRFPIGAWVGNILGNGEIGFLFVTPFIFLAGLAGIIFLINKGDQEQRLLSWWLVLTVVLQVILVRGTSQRYLESYLPLLVLFSVVMLDVVLKKIRTGAFRLALVMIFFVIPFVLTVVQVVEPIWYLSFSSFSRFSENGSYVTGRTSGYGIDQAILYLEELPKGKNIFVGESLYTGNPESAFMVWFAKHTQITLGYLDRSLLGDSVNDVDCIRADVPVYFVSKEDEVAGLEKFLQNVIYLKNPYNKNVIGIWKLKEKCDGKSLPVRLVNIK